MQTTSHPTVYSRTVIPSVRLKNQQQQMAHLYIKYKKLALPEVNANLKNSG